MVKMERRKDDPWPVVRGVHILARIVRLQAPGEVGSQASVAAGRIAGTAKHVDDGLVSHVLEQSNRAAARDI